MLRRVLLGFLCASLVVSPAHATWSIVVVNRRTGEVAVGGATCIARINLMSGLATVVPGVGAGVIQASGDSDDLLPMTEGFRARLDPSDILDLVIAADSGPRLLQTGIVSLYPGAPVTFTGGGVGQAKKGVVGEVGDLAYAIQGNVLAGGAVIDAAERAVRDTPGDLSQKLLAGMVAAREFGGDGRCSCDFGRPDRCGSPPQSFEKSAHVGFLIVTRIGDDVPPCTVPNDCTQGRFHLRLNIRGADADERDPDPVDQLVERYATWRAARAGRPDGILSSVEAVDALPADGLTKRTVTVHLVDIEGVPLTHGGADVRVAGADGARLHASVGPVSDLGDGRYRFTLTSTTRVGTDRLVIQAADDLLDATLYPFLEVRSEAPRELFVGVDALSAGRGGSAPFVLNRPDFAGGSYLLLASASGSQPGTPLGRGTVLPLVRDGWFALSLLHAGDPRVLPGTYGTLDAIGRAEASCEAPAGALRSLIGRRLTWAAVLAQGARVATTPPVELEIGP